MSTLLQQDAMNAIDRADTVSNEGYADRLIARANVFALLAIAEQLEKIAGVVSSTDATHPYILAKTFQDGR